MAPLGASALDGVPVAIDGPAVATGSAVHEDLDVFLGRELSCEVFAQAGLVARHDEVVSGHNGHSSIFHETVLRVKVGGAGRGRAGLSGPVWKDDGGCRACPEPARRLSLRLWSRGWSRRGLPLARRGYRGVAALPEIGRRSGRHRRTGGPRPGSSGRN